MLMSIILLGIIFLVQITEKIFPKLASKINKNKFFYFTFLFSILIIFSYLIFIDFEQYKLWKSNDFSKFLLPPYQSIFYFIKYSFSHFFSSYLISLIVSLVFIFSAARFNKKKENLLFYDEELWLGATALFLCGNPGWLFYFLTLTSFYFLIHCCVLIFKKGKQERISSYYLWIPIAISVIIMINLFQKLPLWNILKLS